MRTGSEGVRAFLAFDVEDEKVLERIVRAQRELMPTGAHLKLVKPENIHVTMRFLGTIDSRMVELISKFLDEMKFQEFEIELKGLGAFPRPTSPRVIWIGVGRGNEELTKVFNEMEPRLNSIGIRSDIRPFHAHVTIARVKGGERGRLIEVMRKWADYEFGVISGKYFRLRQSVLTSKGPVYSTVHEAEAVRS